MCRLFVSCVFQGMDNSSKVEQKVVIREVRNKAPGFCFIYSSGNHCIAGQKVDESVVD